MKSRISLDGILKLSHSEQERILAELDQSNPVDAGLLREALMFPTPARLERIEQLKMRILSYLDRKDGHARFVRLRTDLNYKRYGTDFELALVTLESTGRIIRVGTGRRGDPKEIGLLKKS